MDKIIPKSFPVLVSCVFLEDSFFVNTTEIATVPEYLTVGKVQKRSNSMCYTPSSESFRITRRFFVRGFLTVNSVEYWNDDSAYLVLWLHKYNYIPIDGKECVTVPALNMYWYQRIASYLGYN
jgi:hypothetical protein